MRRGGAPPRASLREKGRSRVVIDTPEPISQSFFTGTVSRTTNRTILTVGPGIGVTRVYTRTRVTARELVASLSPRRTPCLPLSFGGQQPSSCRNPFNIYIRRRGANGDEKRGVGAARNRDRESTPSAKLYGCPRGEDKGTILLSSAAVPRRSSAKLGRPARCNNIFPCPVRYIRPLIYVALHLTVPCRLS